MVVIPSKGFSEEIGQIVHRGKLFENNLFVLDKFPDIMMADVDVFDLTMVLRILGKS